MQMNLNNKLKLKQGTLGRVIALEEGITVFIPTRKGVANAKVLQVNSDGFFSVHWLTIWNTNGDFRTELMQFDNDLVLDVEEKSKRNAYRKASGLIEII